MLYDSFHIQIKGKQNRSMVIEVRKGLKVGQGQRVEWEWAQEYPPECWEHYLALSDGYMMIQM